MGLFSDNSKSSITFYINNLSNYSEIEWYQFHQLTESIVLKSNGSKEAVEAIRKKLKHGNVQQKIRVLEVLKLLSENSSQRFHRDLILSEKMKARIEYIIESSTEDLKVKKMIMELLYNLITRFKNERGINSIKELHEKGKLLLYSNSNKKLFILNNEVSVATTLSNDLLNEMNKNKNTEKTRKKYQNCLEENTKLNKYLNQISFQQHDMHEEYFTVINKLKKSNQDLSNVITRYESIHHHKQLTLGSDILQDPFADPV